MILLWGGLLLILLWRLWRVSASTNAEWLVQWHKGANGLGLNRFIATLKPWLEPGWSVQIFSFKVQANNLPIGNLKLTPDSFYRLKQALLWLGGLAFCWWLWFGLFSFKNALLFAVLWILFFNLPELYLRYQSYRYQRVIETEVPYFLDLLTLTLQSGANLEQALFSTTKCYKSYLSQKVAKRLKELRWGRSMETVLMDLKSDINNRDFSHFLNSVRRAKKLGVSLSETLIIQVEILRTKRRQRAEALSRTAAVKISLPLVLFIFPALLIIYIGPGILQLLSRT